MKTPRQARQHAIFKTRLPKRHLVRVDGLFFGTGVTKTIPPNHPPLLLFKTRVMKTIHPQDPSHETHLSKWGNMPFSGLDSRKDSFLVGWLVFRDWSHENLLSKPPTHRSFSRPESWKPSIPGPRSKLFMTRVMKTPPQVRQRAIFKTRLPKSNLVRVDGLFFGTRVPKATFPNHPPTNLFKTRVMKTIHPRSKIQAFQDSSHENLPKSGNMPFSRLDSRKDTLLGWTACFSGLESRKPAFETTRHHTFSRLESWKPSQWLVFQDWSHQNHPSKPSTTTPFQDPSHENHPSRSKIRAFQDSSHENTSPSKATCHFQDSTPGKTPC